MKSPKKIARWTGLIGVLVLVLGSVAHTINSQLIDLGNGLNTAKNILDSEFLFRIGFICGLAMEVIFIAYALLLYQLLKPTNKNIAGLMLLLAMVPVPIFLINQLNHFAVLLSAKQQSIEQMLFFIDLHKHGGFIVSIFFGLWLFPLGYLIFKSSYFPRILGILLMIGCFGYLLSFIQGFLIPNLETTLWSNPALIVTHISELLLMLWLLIKGIDKEHWHSQI